MGGSSVFVFVKGENGERKTEEEEKECEKEFVSIHSLYFFYYLLLILFNVFTSYIRYV